MLFSYLYLLPSDPIEFFRQLSTLSVALTVALTIHEFSHALVARALGDLTAQRYGRLSLNPFRHLDPSGTFLLLVAGFGWGKPVPVNAQMLRGNPRTSLSLVSLAGPASNLITALVLGVLFRSEIFSLSMLVTTSLTTGSFQNILLSVFANLAFLTIWFSVILAIFNMIPLWPLDGFKVVQGIVTTKAAQILSKTQLYGPVILLGVVFMDLVLDLGLLSTILGPPINLLIRFCIG